MGIERHQITDYPILKDRASIRESIEICFEDRAIYKEPKLSGEDARDALRGTDHLDILSNPMYESLGQTIDRTPGFIVPLHDLLLFGKALREAYRLFAQRVYVPKGILKPEEVPEFVKKKVDYALRHEREHARAIPHDAEQRGVRSHYNIGFYMACELVEEEPDGAFTISVADALVPSVEIIDNKQVLTATEMAKIVSAPGDNMSKNDKHQLAILRQRLEGLQK